MPSLLTAYKISTLFNAHLFQPSSPSLILHLTKPYIMYILYICNTKNNTFRNWLQLTNKQIGSRQNRDRYFNRRTRTNVYYLPTTASDWLTWFGRFLFSSRYRFLSVSIDFPPCHVPENSVLSTTHARYSQFLLLPQY